MKDQNRVITEKKEAKKKSIMVPGVAVCLGTILGFALGDYVATRKVTSGLKKICEADPTFESHFWSAVDEISRNEK